MPAEERPHLVTDLSTQLCELASRLAIAAGDLVFEGRKNGLTSISTKSSDTDIVTEFDRASEHLIVEGSGAAGVAALVGRRVDVRGRRVAVIVTGSNIDRARLAGFL